MQQATNKWKMYGIDLFSPVIGNTVHLSLKLSDPSFTPKIVGKLLSEMAGFHLCTPDNKYLLPTNKIPVVQHLPHFKTLEETNQYAIDNMIPDVKECLGRIAANEDTILLAMNHVCGDGGYYKGVIDHINEPKKKLNRLFPISAMETYRDQLKQYDNIPPTFINNDEYLTSIKTDSQRQNVEHVTFEKYPVNSLACFNREKNVCSFLNESTCSSFLFASIIADKITKSSEEIVKTPFGIQILTDLRKKIKGIFPVSLNSFDWFSSYNIHAKPELDMKMIEVYKQLRNDLKEMSKDHRLWDFVRAIGLEDPAPQDKWENRVFINNSNLGQINIKDPLKDLLITCVNHTVPASNMLSLMTYSLADKNGRNEMVQTIRYGSNGISEKYAKMLNNVTKFALQNVHQNMTVKQSIKTIKDYITSNFL